MSQTVMEALWRPFGRLFQTLPVDRRLVSDDRSSDASGPFAADGGDVREREDDDHLRDVPDGAGCTEIWEHLSERQAAEAEADD